MASAALRGFLLLAASLPVYLLAVWSYAAAFLATATPDVKGWMFVLFPVLAIPPFIPWLVVAVPVAVALSTRHIAIRCLLIAGTLVMLTAVQRRFFARTEDADGRLVSAIGSLPFELFVGGVWLATVVVFLILRKQRTVFTVA